MTESSKLSQLQSNSIRIWTQNCMVRIDDANEETKQRYLTISGSAEGFRWLSRHLQSLAESAEKHGSAGNIVAPWDFGNSPITLEEWDSIDFHCMHADAEKD